MRRCSSGGRAVCSRNRSALTHSAPTASRAACRQRRTGTPVEILSPDIPDSLAQTSFDVGGPLAKNRTFFFGAFDYTHQDRTAPITTPLVPPGTEIVGKYRQVLADGRIDHQISTPHRLMVRANLDRFYDTNPQDVVSGNVLPSAGRKFTRHTFSIQANETAVIGSFLNEARVSYLHGDPITRFEPVQPSTQFTRAGAAPFTAGESRSVDAYSHVAQFSDSLSVAKGSHYLRAGAGAARSVSGGDGTEFGSAFVLGQYTVLAATTRPPGQLTLADMQRYQQSFTFGKSTYELSQWLITAFFQDSYRVHPNATIDLGVRYDRQTFTDATANFAPRVGFAWNPGGDPRTAIRGGYGMYYTQLRANAAAGLELGGPEGVFTYQATPGQTGFPACLECTPVPFDPAAAAPTLPARNVTIRPGRRDYYSALIPGFSAIPDCPDGECSLNGRPCYPSKFVNPRSQVTSIGIERELMPHLYVAADYVHQHVANLDRAADLNAPSFFERTAPGQTRTTAAADATRPIAPVNGGYRVINVTENLGVADYDALQTSVNFRGHRRVQGSISYTLSKATNTTEPDGNGIGPNDNNRLGEDERGPSLLDQRHRAVFTLTCNLPYNITAGTVTQLASARPINSTTGSDNNGDGSNNDRAVIDGRVVGKSSFRGTPTSDVSVFAETRLPLASHSLLVRVEAFNLFNHANVLGRNSVWGNGATPLPTFQATPGLAATDPARMVQFQVRYLF